MLSFHAAYKAKDLRAAVPLHAIRELYAIVREAKEQGIDAAARLALRTEKSLPILDAFEEWVAEQLPLVPPKSLLGKALGYATHQKPFIRRCFTDGRFEIDNGLVERTLRKACIGRRNYTQRRHEFAAPSGCHEHRRRDPTPGSPA